MINNEKIYYTTKEIAEHFSVTTQTIYNWRAQGLPFEKLGPKLVRFKLSDVTEWIKEYNMKTK